MTEEMRQAFLARLWELQAAAGLTDVQLAGRLGLSQSYVSRLRRGERGTFLSLNLASRAVAVFPELRSLLSVDVLAGREDSDDNQSTEEGANREQ